MTHRPNPHSAFRTPHSAFTLTELLIVVTIIAILASLITAAAVNAMRRAREAQITMEITQVSNAFEDLKNQVGAYPPNGLSGGAGGIDADFTRMFKKAFPRHQEPPGLIAALAGSGGGLSGGMNGAEAVYFWLGGFSDDPKYPISGQGGPSFLVANGEVLEDRSPRVDFALTQLGPRDANGVFHDTASGGTGRFLTYADPVTGDQRRINFWSYRPGGSEQPLIYFDASRYKPAQYDPDISGGALQLFAFKKLREGASSGGAYTVGDLTFVNDGKFQLLHCGTDDAWGDWSPMAVPSNNPSDSAANVLLFPAGPFLGDAADTLTNFTSGTIENAAE